MHSAVSVGTFEPSQGWGLCVISVLPSLTIKKRLPFKTSVLQLFVCFLIPRPALSTTSGFCQ